MKRAYNIYTASSLSEFFRNLDGSDKLVRRIVGFQIVEVHNYIELYGTNLNEPDELKALVLRLHKFTHDAVFEHLYGSETEIIRAVLDSLQSRLTIHVRAEGTTIAIVNDLFPHFATETQTEKWNLHREVTELQLNKQH